MRRACCEGPGPTLVTPEGDHVEEAPWRVDEPVWCPCDAPQIGRASCRERVS